MSDSSLLDTPNNKLQTKVTQWQLVLLAISFLTRIPVALRLMLLTPTLIKPVAILH